MWHEILLKTKEITKKFVKLHHLQYKFTATGHNTGRITARPNTKPLNYAIN